MQFGFALQQEQSQKLLMTTQMKQAIELLQCASVDLIGHLETFVADNPCVDLASRGSPAFVDAVEE